MDGEFRIVQDAQLAEAIMQFKAAVDSLRIITDLVRKQVANPPTYSPNITVDAPQVTVEAGEAPDVVVNVPPLETPVVHVQIPEVEREQPRALRVERGPNGFITRVVPE